MTDKRVLDVGRRIRQHRHSLELSQEELAAEADLDRSYIGQVERGEKNITLVNVFRIADALEIEAWEMFTDD